MATRSEDHPLISHLLAASGVDALPEESIAAELLFLDPATRSQVLHKTKGWIMEDDGVSLRRKAQLMNLDRQMRQIDRDMRKAGR